MKKIYITSLDTKFIYEHLKTQGYYEWFIILRCIEEIQCDYTFLSKLSWNNILREREIIDGGGAKNTIYEISESIKDDIREALALLNIDDLDKKIVGEYPSVTAKELEKQLYSYDCIKAYNDYGFKFRIDSFKNYVLDKNGCKIYAEKYLDSEHELEYNEKITTCCLYIAEWADKMEHTRPKKFRMKHYDKKIGVGKVVSDRMDMLSIDKRSGGTLSPMYVRALRAWCMPIKFCSRLEDILHDFFDEKDRCVGGEWYWDYYDDLIELVELKIQEMYDDGHKIIEIRIDKENEDITFIDKLPKDFWKNLKEEEDDFVPTMKYEL